MQMLYSKMFYVSKEFQTILKIHTNNQVGNIKQWNDVEVKQIFINGVEFESSVQYQFSKKFG